MNRYSSSRSRRAAKIRSLIVPVLLSTVAVVVLVSSTGCGCDCFQEYCFDGRDNDGDGRIDCDDGDCAIQCGHLDLPGATGFETICDDGIDNDSDGLIDCDDSNCLLFSPCVSTPAQPENCDNGLDDDGNGLTDCLDPLCYFAQSCRDAVCPALSPESCLMPDGIFAYSSLGTYPRRGETLRLNSFGMVYGLSWWGVNTGESTHQFVVSYFLGIPPGVSPSTIPGTLLRAYSEFTETLIVQATLEVPISMVIVDDDGDGIGPSYPLMRYTARHAPFSMTDFDCHVVVIHDDTNQFAWARAIPLDGSSSFKQDVSAAWSITSPAGSFDLSLCPILDPEGGGQIVGACCLSGVNTCYDNTTQTDCNQLDGIYRGDSSTCATSPPCGVSMGACCIGGGDCILATQGGCDGIYQGDGTICQPEPPCP